MDARSRAWQRAHPEAVRAQGAVRRALQHGVLVRQPCEACGAVPAQAHHDDYRKPLDVRWLCAPHHWYANRGLL